MRQRKSKESGELMGVDNERTLEKYNVRRRS
jgi:hypothetical protein